MAIRDEHGESGFDQLRVRLASPEDGLSLAKLRWRFHVEDHDATAMDDPESFNQRFLAFWEEAISDGRWRVWVAERGGEIVANVWVFLIDKVPRPVASPATMGYLTNMYTVPEARNQGLGAELLRRVTDWAEERQLELLVVWPSSRSVSFYKRAGFRPNNEVLELHIADTL